MPSQNVMSLAVGRMAGKNAGVPPEDLGKLSIMSYFVGNPILAIVAARSMARKGDGKPKPENSAGESKTVVETMRLAASQAERARESANAAAISETNAAASADAARRAAAEAQAAAKASGRSTKN